MSNVLAARMANTQLLIAADQAEWLGHALNTVGPEYATVMAKMREKGSRELLAAGDGFWPEEDSWISYYRPYNVVDGTLMIPIKGMLLNDFPYAFGDWATGYAYIVKAFERGWADPEVKRIAMICSSPGGEVAGCFDAVDKVFARRDEKPLQSFINESAYSAAFAWSSIAPQINITRTGGTGSCGVVTSHVDASAALEKQGIKITFIYAGDHKVDGNYTEKLDPKVKARIQARVDGMYKIFVESAARNLGLSEEQVRATQALTYSADEAVEVGFAHEVKSFDDALAAFSGEPEKLTVEEFVSMITPEEQAQIDRDKELARSEGAAAGVKAEQARIGGILASEEAKTRPTLAQHLALKTDMSVEAAAGMLAVAAPEAKTDAAAAGSHGADFSAAMGQDNPNLGSGDASQDQNAGQPTAADIDREFRAANGIAEPGAK